ncbi:hypothetical protein PUN4_550240 [Paraburkholderia unamae]|nr:hypothetical protein PUN4_550240 [Paraburkholderia unamae]
MRKRVKTQARAGDARTNMATPREPDARRGTPDARSSTSALRAELQTERGRPEETASVGVRRFPALAVREAPLCIPASTVSTCEDAEYSEHREHVNAHATY